MSYFYSIESVSSGHPDRVADAISNNLLDYMLSQDPNTHAGIEVMVGRGFVVIGGEVKTTSYVDVNDIVRNTIKEIGYTKPEYMFDYNSVGIFNALNQQSPDIDMGVTRTNEEDQGAGDQCILMATSTNETENMIPLISDIANNIMQELEDIRKNHIELMPYLRPDAKTQVTIEYNEDGTPLRIDTIVLSTQHDEFAATDEEMHKKIYDDVVNILIPRVKARYDEKIQQLFGDDIRYLVNPTGRFVIGGPAGDCGCVSRKLAIDGGIVWGGGGMSGKDGATKADRGSAYAARRVCKNCVAAGLCDKMELQIAYAIGVAEPVSFYVNTHGTNHTKYSDSEIALKLQKLFDCRPYAIAKELHLKEPIYAETSSGGHFGRTPKIVTKRFKNYANPEEGDIVKTVELFTWEKLDMVDKIKEEFGLN